VVLGTFQALVYEFHIPSIRLDTGGRLFLTDMQDIDDFLESYRIDRPVGIAVEAFNDFEHTRSFAFPWLCVRMLAAKLCKSKCIADVVHDLLGKCKEIVF